MRIQHNIMAMNAYRNYTNNVSAMKANLEKLSSGYKINRAGDDAAGLAISEKMRAQITGLETAQKNAKDGISLVQTAEGALTEVHDMLNRMVELASQSANGTYDNTTDRAQMQKEIDQLLSEINRIADSSNFNGIKLLDGSMDGGAIEAAKYDATGMLPAVGKVLGTDTVLHSEAGQSADKSTFAVDFHNTKISGVKGTEFNLKIGDVTLTGTLAKDFAEGAELDGAKIVAALKDGTTTDVSFKIGTANYDPTNFTVNGAKFTVDTTNTDATKGRIAFTSDESVNPDMKVSIALSDKDAPAADPIGVNPTDPVAAGTAPTVTVTAPTANTATVVKGDATAGTKASITINLAGAALDKAASKLTLSFGTGMAVDSAAIADADKADAAKLAAAFNGKTVTVDGVTLTATVTGTSIKFEEGTAADPTTDATWDGITAGTLTATGVAAAAAPATVEVDFGDKTGAEVIGQSVTIEGKTFEFVKTGGDVTTTGNVKVEVAENADADTVAGALKTAVLADTTAKANLSTTANDHTITDGKLVFKAKDNTTKLTGALATKTPDAPKLSGDYNVSTTVLQKKADGAGERLASTYFDLTKEMAGNGSSVTIGKTAYTFTTDAADKALITANTDNKVYVGDLDLTTKEGLTTAAERLTNVAKGNATYTVGHDGKRMTFTEIKGQTAFVENGLSSLDTLENIEKSFGFKVAAQEADATKGLTLQIGDTADSFNQLKVNIKDMHAASLGLDKIKISDQDSAAKAVDAIKDAINTVSDVRGTLGATQNRLDHTINNLSVMTENIQDAESTIRDVDVAEEMMAYTKNNILIQSAQAMLAQANQVPQGVLQLLQ